MVAWDPLCCPFWQTCNGLLQCYQIDDPLSIVIFCPQPSPAGVWELLAKSKWPADLLQCQHTKALMMLLWGAVDALQDGSPQVGTVQPIVGGELVRGELCLFGQEQP